MTGIQIRDLPAYDGDPGDGIRIEPKPQMVEIGISFDGAERQVVHVDPETLIDIAEEALGWEKVVYRETKPTKVVADNLVEV